VLAKTAGKEPFSLEHFEGWAAGLVLDNGGRVVLEDWQRRFVADIFEGFPVCWLVVPEGNGKTTLLASLGLYGLRFAEDASIPIAASSRDQARIMYRQMKGFVKRSKLEKVARDGTWFECFDGYRQIHLRGPGKTKRGDILGQIELHAADAGTADGVIPFPFAFLDELHRHKDLGLHRTWTGKLDKRGAQEIGISTAGAPGHEFEVARERIPEQATEEGSFRRYVAGRMVMHEYALRDRNLSEDLEAVKSANPLRSVTIEALAAKRADPTMTDSHWLRFSCNVAANTDAAELFIDLAVWDALAEPGSSVEQNAYVCLGADGSRTHDTTVVAHASAVADRIDVGCRVFSVRKDVAHHVLHVGGKVDFEDVEDYLIGLFDEFSPLETAYDPRYLERSMEIVDLRLPSAAVIAVEPQSKHARDAYQALFTAVVEGKLRHNGDPVIAAHLANCAVVRDERNQEIRRLRKIDPRKPIDAVPALALAVWRATLAQPSVYESREAVAV
jgi:phage terminase large subunit-like protein